MLARERGTGRWTGADTSDRPVFTRLEEAKHPVDGIGLRSGRVVVAEAKGVADQGVRVIEVGSAP